MKNPITPEGAASARNPLPPVPTTKILAISHFMGTPMTPAQRAQIMSHEVHDTAVRSGADDDGCENPRGADRRRHRNPVEHASTPGRWTDPTDSSEPTGRSVRTSPPRSKPSTSTAATRLTLLFIWVNEPGSFRRTTHDQWDGQTDSSDAIARVLARDL